MVLITAKGGNRYRLIQPSPRYHHVFILLHKEACRLHPYLPLLIYALIALAIPVGMSLIGTTFGKAKPEGAKYLAYESGAPTAPLMGRFPAKFYLVAMMFVIFDVEAAAMYPWAVLLREMGTYGLWVMTPLLIAFIIGDVYVWKKGGFEWR